MNSYNSIKSKVEKMNNVTTRPMFGYQCYLINKKFFVGFNKKNDCQIIVRLPNEKQETAITNNSIEPFSHGAKMGWIEIDSKKISNANMAMKWIIIAHDNAVSLAKKT